MAYSSPNQPGRRTAHALEKATQKERETILALAYNGIRKQTDAQEYSQYSQAKIDRVAHLIKVWQHQGLRRARKSYHLTHRKNHESH